MQAVAQASQDLAAQVDRVTQTEQVTVTKDGSAMLQSRTSLAP